jgi:hypothetical protein
VPPSRLSIHLRGLAGLALSAAVAAASYWVHLERSPGAPGTAGRPAGSRSEHAGGRPASESRARTRRERAARARDRGARPRPVGRRSAPRPMAAHRTVRAAGGDGPAPMAVPLRPVALAPGGPASPAARAKPCRTGDPPRPPGASVAPVAPRPVPVPETDQRPRSTAPTSGAAEGPDYPIDLTTRPATTAPSDPDAASPAGDGRVDLDDHGAADTPPSDGLIVRADERVGLAPRRAVGSTTPSGS